MALTRDFKETVAKRAEEDPEFRYALLLDAINELLTGDLDVAKILLRDYINASPQFEAVAKEMKKNTKSIQRMLGPHGNPTAENLTALLKAVQKLEGIRFEARRQ
jgi:DNA-binding phage protein